MKPRVLLVDDVAENLEILLQILEPQDFVTLVASDGPSALEVASQAHPDLVLLDIMMPGMDGFEVCRRLRENATTADIPVIFLSALHDVDWKVKGFEAGGFDYISKPFWEEEVLARVQTHLRLRAAQRESQEANAQLRREIEQRKKAEEALYMANLQLEEANRKLQDLALEDGLTGLANRRRLDEHLSMSWLQMAREGQPMSVLMCDVDCFKLYNDRYGHQEGDECLRAVAHTIKSVLKRPADLVGRYGGEEFVVVLCNTDLDGAMVVANEILRSVGALQIPHEASTAGSTVSLSVGVSSTYPHRDIGYEQLVATADEALYEAKREGRARVVSLA